MGELLVSGLPNDVLWAIIVIMGIIMLMLVAELFYTRVQLRGRQERYWWVLGASDMYMFEYDLANDELLLSEHFSSLLGISSRHIFQFSQVVMHTKNKIFKRGLEHVAHILNNTQNETVESRFELTRGDGSIGIFRVCCNSFYDDQGCLTSKVGILRDITREVHVEEALRARAERDSLTGVYNAGMIRRLIEHDFEEQTRDRTGAFVMLDIDHFKRINDTLGHQAGDKVLQGLSRVWRQESGAKYESCHCLMCFRHRKRSSHYGLLLFGADILPDQAFFWRNFSMKSARAAAPS